MPNHGLAQTSGSQCPTSLSDDRMILIGSFGTLAGSSVLLACVVGGIWTPMALFLPTSLGTFSQGLVMANAQAAAVSVDPHAAGAASGLSGFLQMALAGLAAQIVGSIGATTPYPMAIGMCFCAAMALASALVAVRSMRPPSPL